MPQMMNAILKMLKPNALTAILLLVILLVQGAYFTSWSTTHSSVSNKPIKTSLSFGIGSPIRVSTVNGMTNRDINWPILLTNLAVSYLLAAIVASAFARGTGFRHPAMTYAAVAVVMVMVGFVVSIGISRLYWGYYFELLFLFHTAAPCLHTALHQHTRRRYPRHRGIHRPADHRCVRMECV